MESNKEPAFETQVSLFVFEYGKVQGAFGTGVMIPAGSIVYFDHRDEDGWNYYTIPTYISEEGEQCYCVRIPDDYVEEQVIEVTDPLSQSSSLED